MSETASRFFASLPEYFSKDPEPEPAISIESTAADTLITVASATIRLQAPSLMLDRTIDCRGLTMADLVNAISGIFGFTASVISPSSVSAPAAALLDTSQNPSVNNRFMRFTSTLWLVSMPIVWALEAAQANSIAADDQTMIKTASGQWVDLWGSYYGGLDRAVGELDRPYAERIIREVLRWRLNGIAIAQILYEDLGLNVRVDNLHDQAWVVGGKLGHLVGPKKWARTTFEVVVLGSRSGVDFQLDYPTGVIWKVDRNRAAGTMPFYRTVTGGGVEDPLDHRVPVHMTRRAQIVQDPVWQVGGPLGPVMFPNTVGVLESYTAGIRERVFGGGPWTPFILGVSNLGGPDRLGSPGSGSGITVSDVASIEVF
jgi:hypothetical protein